MNAHERTVAREVKAMTRNDVIMRAIAKEITIMPRSGRRSRRRRYRPRSGWRDVPMQDLVVAMEGSASTLAALKHILTHHGRFAELYTDRGSHFC
jgi:hypothetical protein